MPDSLDKLTDNMEEVPVGDQIPFPQPPIEEVIHNCIINVMHVPTPEGQVPVLQFITHVKVISIKLDEATADALSSKLKKSPIQVASLLDLPKGIRP